MATPAVRISHDGNGILVEILKPKRITHHGFGSFLEKPKKGEVVITKKALTLLLNSPERRGVMGFEIFNGPVVSWGDPGNLIIDNPADISVASGAKAAIKQLFVVKE